MRKGLNYLNYKLISSKADNIWLLVALLCTVIFVPLILNQTVMSRISKELIEGQVELFNKGLLFVVFILTLLSGVLALKRYLKSREYLFLKGLPLTVSDSLFIMWVKTLMVNLFGSLIYCSIVLSILDKGIFNLLWVPLEITYYCLTLYVIELVILFLLMKITIKEIRLTITILCVVLFAIGSKSYLTGLIGEPSLKLLILDFLVQLGRAPFMPIVGQILSPSPKQIIVFTFVIILLCASTHFPKFLNSFSDNDTVRYLYLHKVFKMSPNYLPKNRTVSHLHKDFTILRTNSSFIILEFVFIGISSLLLINRVQNFNSIIISSGVFVFLFSLLSPDIFNIDKSCVWLYKSFPIKNSSFFLYKFFTNYILSIINPMFFLVISLFLGRISLLHWIVSIGFVSILAIILCLTWSSVVFRYFPDLRRSNIPLLVTFILTSTIPMVPILIVTWYLKKGLSKWQSLEV